MFSLIKVTESQPVMICCIGIVCRNRHAYIWMETRHYVAAHVVAVYLFVRNLCRTHCIWSVSVCRNGIADEFSNWGGTHRCTCTCSIRILVCVRPANVIVNVYVASHHNQKTFHTRGTSPRTHYDMAAAYALEYVCVVSRDPRRIYCTFCSWRWNKVEIRMNARFQNRFGNGTKTLNWRLLPIFEMCQMFPYGVLL